MSSEGASLHIYTGHTSPTALQEPCFCGPVKCEHTCGPVPGTQTQYINPCLLQNVNTERGEKSPSLSPSHLLILSPPSGPFASPTAAIVALSTSHPEPSATAGPSFGVSATPKASFPALCIGQVDASLLESKLKELTSDQNSSVSPFASPFLPPRPSPSPPPAQPQRRRKSPQSKKRPTKWSSAEDDSCVRWMRAIHPEHTGRLEELWKEVAAKMRSQDGIERTSASVKNTWNRRLRAKSRYDERKTPGVRLQTSLVTSRK